MRPAFRPVRRQLDVERRHRAQRAATRCIALAAASQPAGIPQLLDEPWHLGWDLPWVAHAEIQPRAHEGAQPARGLVVALHQHRDDLLALLERVLRLCAARLALLVALAHAHQHHRALLHRARHRLERAARHLVNVHPRPVARLLQLRLDQHHALLAAPLVRQHDVLRALPLLVLQPVFVAAPHDAGPHAPRALMQALDVLLEPQGPQRALRDLLGAAALGGGEDVADRLHEARRRDDHLAALLSEGQVPQRGQRKAVRGLVVVVLAKQHLAQDLNAAVGCDELLVPVIHCQAGQALAQLPDGPKDAMAHGTLAGCIQNLQHLNHQ
mmetsp:Transcript_34207/g.86530  ORF Transcript_34207/g.86530 Transcript_34207/m.86530 type:complete len:326 (-) Transcript_34207:1031-2008(-)